MSVSVGTGDWRSLHGISGVLCGGGAQLDWKGRKEWGGQDAKESKSMLHFQGKQALVCVVDQAVVWGTLGNQ